MSDDALFNSGGGNAAPAEAPTPASEAAPSAPATPAAPSADPAEPATAPSGRLREEAEARRIAEKKAADLEAEVVRLRQPAQPAQQPQTPAEPPQDPDFWEDPKKFVAHHLTPVQRDLANMRVSTSKLIASSSADGKAAVEAADKALGELFATDRAEAQRVAERAFRTDHPWGALIDWNKSRETQQRIGSDPDAFVQAEIAKMLADPAKKAALLSQVTGQPAAVDPAPEAIRQPLNVSPSLSKIGGASPAGADGPRQQSDAELFASVTGRK